MKKRREKDKEKKAKRWRKEGKKIKKRRQKDKEDKLKNMIMKRRREKLKKENWEIIKRKGKK